jgi:hypothetical protein
MSANGSTNGIANGDGHAAKKQKTEGTSLHDDHQCVLVLDYGSQYTQLICRRIRDIGVFSMMFPGDASMVGFSCARVCCCYCCTLSRHWPDHGQQQRNGMLGMWHTLRCCLTRAWCAAFPAANSVLLLGSSSSQGRQLRA